MKFHIVALLATLLPSLAQALPVRYTELNKYVVKAPNQGDAVTCLFMASTGAMEILLSKKWGIKNPPRNGPTDLAERFLIKLDYPATQKQSSWFEAEFLKFNSGEAVLAKHIPFEAYDENGNDNTTAVWSMPENFATAPRVANLPKVETVFLFSEGAKYSRGVLDASHVKTVKEALVKYQSPIITIGNDQEFWHATVITGYDDQLEGDCYELDSSICKGKKGSFFVRDSFGSGLEARSYEWFIRRQNSAAVAKLAR